ncbi:MAG: J domain-containing protein [Oscillospiraceae bacterium]|nr:J domain-containing protein [Oscillospiraceae bacterium]
MDIWGILGIEPGSDIEAIRAAYSEKVKIHHPEDDPEGFMRLRSAYKAAVQMASQRPGDTANNEHADSLKNTEVSSSREVSGRFDFSGVEDKSAGGLKNTDSLKNADAPSNRDSSAHFDFSVVEEESEMRFEEEKQLSESVIARLTDLYKSADRGKFEKWEILLQDTAVEKLKTSEYFTWAFLDFIAMHTQIPPSIRNSLIDPFLREQRDLWIGSELWYEFDVVELKIISKSEKIIRRVKNVQRFAILIAIASGFFAFGIGRLVGEVVLPQSDAYNSVLRHLLSGYYGALSVSVAVGAAGIVWIAVIITTAIMVRRIVVNSRGAIFADTWISENNHNRSFAFFAIIIVAIIYIAVLSSTIGEASGIAADISEYRAGLVQEIRSYAGNMSLKEEPMRLGVRLQSRGVISLTIPEGLELEAKAEIPLASSLGWAFEYSFDESEGQGSRFLIRYTQRTRTLVSLTLSSY